MQPPELVIFDCDGVLVDSEIIAARVDIGLLAEAGVDIALEDFVERYAGLTFKETVLRIEEEHQVPLQASIIDRSREILDRRLAREVRPIDGAQAAVLSISAPKCVCSNSPPERLEAMLKRVGLDRLFQGNVFSARAIPSAIPKPAPDVFLFAAEKMKAQPGRTFVIEDSVHGIAGAKAAGMRVVGFTGAAHSFPGHADMLIESGAETVINKLADFPAVVEALSVWSEDAAL